MLHLIHWIVNYCHKAGYVIDRPDGNNMYTIMLFKQPLAVSQNGKMEEVPENSCIVYEPFAPQLYYNLQHDYHHDGVFFDGEAPFSLFEDLGIPVNRAFPVNNPSAVASGIQSIAAEAIRKSRHSPEILDLRIRDLIYTLADNVQLLPGADDSYYQRLSQIRQDILLSPETDWDIEKTAKDLYISVSYLQHLYKLYFGISPRQEIIQSRLAQAEYLLRLKEKSVSAISEACGYANEEHFIRQFKKYRGITPKSYQQSTADSFRKK